MGFPSGKGSFGGGGGGGSGGPRTGEVLTGMVKSYNRKGFGFIMCQNLDVDVYFSRESIAPQLQTSDLAGEYVQFEVTRFADGKLQARNIRAVGETDHLTRGPDGFGGITAAGRGKGCLGKGLLPTSMLPGGHADEEDRSRDWYCENCGERNFVKRFECYKCKAPRPREDGGIVPPTFAPPAPRRTLSPHAGSRAMREMFRQRAAAAQGGGGGAAAARSRSRPRRSAKRGKSESSDDSSSSSSEKRRRRKKKKEKKKKKRKDSNSSGDSSSDSSSDSDDAGAAGGGKAEGSSSAPSNPEIEKAKAEVLEKLLKLKEIEQKENRMKEWRALLRDWHPDKNPDKVEVATAVFQFLQKGKALIDS